jgi:hypothetical protein
MASMAILETVSETMRLLFPVGSTSKSPSYLMHAGEARSDTMCGSTTERALVIDKDSLRAGGWGVPCPAGFRQVLTTPAGPLTPLTPSLAPSTPTTPTHLVNLHFLAQPSIYLAYHRSVAIPPALPHPYPHPHPSRSLVDPAKHVPGSVLHLRRPPGCCAPPVRRRRKALTRRQAAGLLRPHHLWRLRPGRPPCRL